MEFHKDKAIELLRKKREVLRFTDEEFAQFLDLGEGGSDKLRQWEATGKIPSTKLDMIARIPDQIPFPRKSHELKFIDLFAGIGGMRLGFQESLGLECVFSSEWDSKAQKTYAVNFGDLPSGDITRIKASDIPDHDILLAGFPCQAFSQAGQKRGFYDTRGTMFFEIQRILAEKRPKAFLLENVRQLKGHNKGRTLDTILEVLRGTSIPDIPEGIPMSEEARAALSKQLNYWVDFKVLSSRDFGLPQNRQRIYIVGFNKDYFDELYTSFNFQFPAGSMSPTRLGDILEPSESVDPKYTITERMWDGHRKRREKHRERGNGFGYSVFHEDSPYANTISARYWKDGSEILIDQDRLGKRPRTLTPLECRRLQGFPDGFIVDYVSKRYAYQQFGNSVSVPVIAQLAKEIVRLFSSFQSEVRIQRSIMATV